MALWGGDAVRQSWTTQRGRQTDPVASGRPKRAEPERGKQWEKGKPPQEGQGGHSVAPSPSLAVHSAFTGSNSVPGHHGNPWPDAFPKDRPICPPYRGVSPRKEGSPATTPSGPEV